MDVVHPRCAGIDCSKKDAKVCVRIQGQGARTKSATVSTWGATTSQILALREHLIAEKVSCVVIESTSDYWKPFYYLLDDDLDVILVNAASVRNLPGRKTDVSDAAWLADLGAHGLVKASFVPPAPIRALRDLTRARTVITRERTRETQRLEKLLEDAGIKLSSVASEITGVSGRAMLEALIAGQRDPAALADLARRLPSTQSSTYMKLRFVRRRPKCRFHWWPRPPRAAPDVTTGVVGRVTAPGKVEGVHRVLAKANVLTQVLTRKLGDHNG
jgi:transposase